jgi:hypothetical protein
MDTSLTFLEFAIATDDFLRLFSVFAALATSNCGALAARRIALGGADEPFWDETDEARRVSSEKECANPEVVGLASSASRTVGRS